MDVGLGEDGFHALMDALAHWGQLKTLALTGTSRVPLHCVRIV